MRRTDRLFDLIQILRDGRLHRAGEMAQKLGVSTRTIWRDMATLMASGMPVEGERGVGYILRAPITLPPMILTGIEIEALRLALRNVAEGEDPTLARAARSLAAKIASVTPAPSEEDDLFDYKGQVSERPPPHIPTLREAVRLRERLVITYISPDGHESHREIRPLELKLSGRIWTLAAWCETKGVFQSFRVDRLVALTRTDEIFPLEAGRELADWRRIDAENP